MTIMFIEGFDAYDDFNDANKRWNKAEMERIKASKDILHFSEIGKWPEGLSLTCPNGLFDVGYFRKLPMQERRRLRRRKTRDLKRLKRLISYEKDN